MLSYFRNVMNAKKSDEGASAVEYGLLVAAIAAIIILVVFALGTYVKGAFKDTCTAFNSSKAVNAVSSAEPSERFKASIQTFSMPIVSADGQRAVLASSQVSGALAGGGFLQLLERQADGNWKVIAFTPLWIA